MVELTSLPRLGCAGSKLAWRRALIRFDPAGECLLHGPDGLRPVLLLRHRSLWFRHIAGLSLRDANGWGFVLWFLHDQQSADAWRRASVRFFNP